METLKKLRATIRRSCVVGLPVAAVEQATMWADTLDAYIKAQESAEPVGQVVVRDGWQANTPRNRIVTWRDEIPNEGTLLYAAPPPRESISREALRNALDAQEYEFEYSEDALIAALRALGIEVKAP